VTTSLDCVVVGQGLAGTTLAWQLRRRGLRVLVIDRESGHASSRIAAGLITPVTGKRLAKSWRWDELFPVAEAFYRSVEAETGVRFFHLRPSLRLLASGAERDELRKRSPNILAGLVRHGEANPDWFKAPFGGFEMSAAARLDVCGYLDASHQHFQRDGGYLVAEVEPGEVEATAGGVRLARLGIEARSLVFCRGFTTDSDPWFGDIRFNAAKGEILTLRIPGLREDRVIHRGIWLAPAGFAPTDGDIFRAGATYTRDPLDSEPTAAGRNEIETRLREVLRLPFEVIDHHAAVRPVIDAGFPVVIRRAQFPQIAFFNGLGSKGSLLAPFFAAQLASLLAGS